MKRLYLWFTKKIWFKPNIFAKIKPLNSSEYFSKNFGSTLLLTVFCSPMIFQFWDFHQICRWMTTLCQSHCPNSEMIWPGLKKWALIIFDESLWLIKFSIIIRSKRVEFQWEFVAGEIQLILERTIHLSSIVLRNEIWYFSKI